MRLSVFFHTGHVVESLPAHVTNKWRFSRMNSKMHVQISLHRKTFFTNFAFVRSNSRMYAHVHLPLTALYKSFAAHLTGKRLFARVPHKVHFKRQRQSKRPTANRACVPFHIGVNQFVRLQSC